jgi:hypothetical protein
MAYKSVRYEVSFSYVFAGERRRGYDYVYGSSSVDAIHRWKMDHMRKAEIATDIKAKPVTKAVYED